MMRGADVGHDAQREDRHLLERTAREHVEQAQERARGLVDDLAHHRPVDTRRGDEDADAVDRQQRQREQQPPTQLGNFSDVCETGGHGLTAAYASMISNRAARLLDLLLGGGRELVGLDLQLLAELTVAQHLDQGRLARHQACVAELVQADRAAGVERVLDVPEVHREVLAAERVLEADLGQTPLHRHLTALEAEAGPVVTGAGLLALDALAGRLARARARPAADALAVAGGAARGFQGVQRRAHRKILPRP